MENKEKSLPSMSINWYPGHMAKTKRLISINKNIQSEILMTTME